MSCYVSFNAYPDYDIGNIRLYEFLDNKSGLSANLTFSRGDYEVDYIVIFKN